MASPTTPTSKVKYAPIETGGVGTSSGDDEGSGSRPTGGGGTCGRMAPMATLVIGLVIGFFVAELGNGNGGPADELLTYLGIGPSPASFGLRCSLPLSERATELPPEMATSGGDRVSGTGEAPGLPFAGRSAVLGRRGMAATSQPLASMAAVDMLKKGGSAVDAGIAANLMIGLVEPMMNGIGGDLFAIIWDPKTKKIVGYNGSGRSGKGFSLEQMRAAALDLAGEDDEGQPEAFVPYEGPLSVTVPGAVRGFCDLHAKYGKLPWEELFEPAIAYALNGFAVSEIIAADWREDLVDTDAACSGSRSMGNANPHACDGFLHTYTKNHTTRPGNRGPKHGEIFTNPELAETYAAIRDGGCAAFYNRSGHVSQKIFASGWAESVGLPITAEDLESHTGEWIHENRSSGKRLLNTTYKGRYRKPDNREEKREREKERERHRVSPEVYIHACDI
jgi:hypothetical protein